jgi:hypothetical protein
MAALLGANNGPLADRDQDARRAVVIVIFLALALSFEMTVDVVSDDLVRAAVTGKRFFARIPV